jgi:threonine dehydratase
VTAASDLTLRDIYAAHRRLAQHITPTPLRHSEWLSAITAAEVLLKLESLQLTNSFKIRGAMNAALRLVASGKPPTIVTASAGNHGRAFAFAAKRLGLEAIVFTPSTAPETKKAAIRRLGATLHETPDYDAAEHRAREYARESGAVYLSPYNHRDVIAGAGTIALEILGAAPDLDVLIVPLGGGGLASGVALAIKSAAPHVSIIGVEVDASRPFATGFAHGRITTISVLPSLADGLIGNLEPGSITFELVRRYVDRLVSVSEADLQRAIRGLVAEEHVIAEGAGATATAAVLAAGAVTPGQRVVALVTGGNIDLATLVGVVTRSDIPADSARFAD